MAIPGYELALDYAASDNQYSINFFAVPWKKGVVLTARIGRKMTY